MPDNAMRKRICYMAAAVTLAMTMLASCAPNDPTETVTPSPSLPTGYVEVPEMDDDMVAPEEDRELTVHYLPQGYAVLESSGQTALFGGCSQEDVEDVSAVLRERGIQSLTTIVVPNGDESRWRGAASGDLWAEPGCRLPSDGQRSL